MTTCGAGETKCGGGCVDTSNDPNNCGSCGNACGTNQFCHNGTCVSGICPEGQTTCSGTCVNLQSDVNNCGRCGNACGANSACTNGACGCASGYTLCSGSCVNLQSDSSHCGSCGTVCPSGQKTCVNGTCQNVCSPACGAGQSCCSGTCVNTQTDPNNCGACGAACGGTYPCVNGACVCQNFIAPCGCCPVGASCFTSTQFGTLCVCPGILPGVCTVNGVQTCVDLESDTNNCGQCGNVCQSNQRCFGTCQTCPSGQIGCGGSCLDGQNDPNNCGACGNVCTTGPCQSGRCTTCASGTFCPGTNTCSNLQSDHDNCGTCGHACAQWEVCQSGTCACGNTLTCDSCSTFVGPPSCAFVTGCSPGNQTMCCPVGATSCAIIYNQLPQTGVCTQSCSCPSTKPDVCNINGFPTCVNKHTDSNNCGSCGNACAAGACCLNGACDGTVCSGKCVDTTSDSKNCGGCGIVCLVDPNLGLTGICTGSACQ
jgi:hypothetical protein